MAQTKGTYLENYLESVATLPAEIRRNFALMRELDTRSQDLIDKIKVYINNGKRAAKELNDDRNVKHIRSDIKTCLEYGEEKVALALQTYELVDKHIRRLDTDLKKFETELEQEDKKKHRNTETPIKEKGKGREARELARDDIVGSPVQPAHNIVAPSPRHKKTERERPAPEPTPTSSSSSSTSSSFTGATPPIARVLNVDTDMPIDPNEPTYCVCNRVSFGEMVGCDNADCKVEWFHFECVGLTHPPKGKWYCPECTAMKKKLHK